MQADVVQLENQLLGRGVSAFMKHQHDLPPGPEREELGRQLEGGALGRAAVAGAGIVLQPEDALIGRLVPVLLAWSYRPTPVHLVYSQTVDQRPSCAAQSISSLPALAPIPRERPLSA